MKNAPDAQEALIDARREIAIAKLVEFQFQSCRIGEMVRDKLIERTEATDALYDAACSNGLTRAHGEDVVQKILADGLDGS
jgi:hypothetical protein